MTDQEALKILRTEYKDYAVGSVIHFTGWAIPGGLTQWIKEEKGWKRLEVRSSTD